MPLSKEELEQGAKEMLDHVGIHIHWAMDNLEKDHPGLTSEQRLYLGALENSLKDNLRWLQEVVVEEP
jgi:hypothetical protein